METNPSQARGQIRLRWIITCGTCVADQEFYGLNDSGSQLARRAGWRYTLARGYCCPTCSAITGPVTGQVTEQVTNKAA